MALLAGHATECDQINRGLRKHHAASAVQLPGQDIEHVGKPGRNAAKGLGTGAHASVQRSPRCCGQLPREVADISSRHARLFADGFGGEAHCGQPDQVYVFRPLFCMAEVHQVFFKQGVHHGH